MKDAAKIIPPINRMFKPVVLSGTSLAIVSKTKSESIVTITYDEAAKAHLLWRVSSLSKT